MRFKNVLKNTPNIFDKFCHPRGSFALHIRFPPWGKQIWGVLTSIFLFSDGLYTAM